MRVKTVRDDILREEELREMFQKLEGNDKIIGKYKTTVHGEPKVQKFNIQCRKTECLLSLLWIFGRRIMEILLLRRKDVWVEEGFLYIRFRALKRKKDSPVVERFTKRITLDHPYVHYIADYISNIENSDSYLFPGHSRPRKSMSRSSRRRRSGAFMIYKHVYKHEEFGFMSSNKAWKIVKFLNPNAYCHLFRHSLATRMAERGYTEDQLMAWFDWKSSKVAHEYVSKGPRMIEVASKRIW